MASRLLPGEVAELPRRRRPMGYGQLLAWSALIFFSLGAAGVVLAWLAGAFR